MVVPSQSSRPMVVCYPPDDVPMVEDPRHPGKFKPDVTWLITEDGKPVDSLFSEKQMRLLTEPLYSSWNDTAGRKKFAAMANVGLFYSPTAAALPSKQKETPADHPSASPSPSPTPFTNSKLRARPKIDARARGLIQRAASPSGDLEQYPRDAKGWLSLQMDNGYAESTDQLALTRLFEQFHDVIRGRMPSFARLERAVRQLVVAVESGSHSVSPAAFPRRM